MVKIKKDGIWRNFLSIWQYEFEQILKEYEESRKILEAEIEKIPTELDKRASQEQKLVIKRFSDASLSLYQMTKYFALLKGIKEIQKHDKDDDFYALMDLYLFGGMFEDKEYDENHIFDYYNALRNFLTKKEWSEDKLRLNFENGYLLDGWSRKEEKVKAGIIFRGGNKYYLGIIDNKSKTIFEDKSLYDDGNTVNCYEKMEMLAIQWKTITGKAYKRDYGDKYSSQVFDFKIEQYKDYLNKKNIIIPDLEQWIELENAKKYKDNQFPDDRKVLGKISRFIIRNYADIGVEDLQKLEDEPYTPFIENVQKLIDKQFKDDYPILKNLLERKFKTRRKFEECKEVYGNVYSLNFLKRIKSDVIDGMVNIQSGEKTPRLYLFQIYNKDFQLDERISGGQARKIEGSEDLETALFRMLFDDRNLKNENGIVLTLNGGAEVFFRDSSLDKELEKRNFKREVERKKRYTENKMFLHVPITLNFGKPDGRYFPANALFNKTALQNPELSEKVKIIGIDRGEKHLAYYSVIDRQGTVLEQGTLNRIYEKKKDGSPIERDEKTIEFDKSARKYVLKKTGRKVKYTDYLVLLECKEKNRLLERRSWDAIESIKDLKKGYISHVVHQLCELILKHLKQDGVPPIIVFEKLNVGFKQGRQKIEKQVYQNLELALARKLNYLTEKGRREYETGGILNALQFTPEIRNFGSDVEKKSQVGIIFYADPSYTSTTCPNCGFRKRINKIAFESAKTAKKKLEEHNVKIHFESGEYKFAFTTYRGRESVEDIVYSGVERIYRKPKANGKGWTADKFQSITEGIDGLLNRCGRPIDKNAEIVSQIKHIDDKDFWRKMMWYFNLILQIRNSANKKYTLNEKTEEVEEDGFDVDFIHCPRCRFHSEKQETWGLFGDYFHKEVRREIVERNESVFNGDANGAYNIARKGIMMITRVKQHPEMIEAFLARNKMTESELEEKLLKRDKYEIKRGEGKDKEVADCISKYPNLFITNEEWDKAVSNLESFVEQ